MGNRNWTPGPWKVNYFVDHDQEGSVVESAEGHGVATLYFRNGNYKVYLAEQSEANAARIVACVNACEGINPEAVPEMLEALRWIRDNCTGLPAVARALAARAITKAEGK